MPTVYDKTRIVDLVTTTPTENIALIPELNDAVREIKTALTNDIKCYGIGSFASLTAAVTAIGATECALVINAATSLTANTTVPANIQIIPQKPGMISKASTYTLTINGPVVNPGPIQWLSGFSAGDVVFGAGSIASVNPDWFGQKGDGSNDDSVPLNIAIASFHRVLLKKPASFYKWSNPITVLTTSTTIEGEDNKDKVEIRSYVASDGAIKVGDNSTSVYKFQLKGIHLKGYSGTETAGIILNNAKEYTISHSTIRGVTAGSFSNAGIFLDQNAWAGNINHVDVLNCTGDGVVTESQTNGLMFTNGTVNNNGGYGFRVRYANGGSIAFNIIENNGLGAIGITGDGVNGGQVFSLSVHSNYVETNVLPYINIFETSALANKIKGLTSSMNHIWTNGADYAIVSNSVQSDGYAWISSINDMFLGVAVAGAKATTTRDRIFVSGFEANGTAWPTLGGTAKPLLDNNSGNGAGTSLTIGHRSLAIAKPIIVTPDAIPTTTEGMFWYDSTEKRYRFHDGTTPVSLLPRYNGNIPPASGTWAQSNIVWNNSPSEAGTAGSKYVIIGWVCTVAGTPGTWLEMRTLTGN